MTDEEKIRANERRRWIRWHEDRIKEWTDTQLATDNEEVEATCFAHIATHRNSINALKAGA